MGGNTIKKKEDLQRQVMQNKAKKGVSGAASKLSKGKQEKLAQKEGKKQEAKNNLLKLKKRSAQETASKLAEARARKMDPDERKTKLALLKNKVKCGTGLAGAKSCAAEFKKQQAEATSITDPRERKNTKKVLKEAQTLSASGVFEECMKEKPAGGRNTCLDEVNNFLQESGGKKRSTAATKALLKRGAAKKTEEKSKECNGKDLTDSDRKACIKDMIKDLKARTTGKKGKSISKLKSKKEVLNAQKEQILNCRRMEDKDAKEECMDAAKKVMKALGKKKVSDWQIEKEE